MRTPEIFWSDGNFPSNLFPFGTNRTSAVFTESKAGSGAGATVGGKLSTSINRTCAESPADQKQNIKKRTAFFTIESRKDRGPDQQ